ncbi:hypothetical protein D3C86_1539270 [compost metagenome]
MNQGISKNFKYSSFNFGFFTDQLQVHWLIQTQRHVTNDTLNFNEHGFQGSHTNAERLFIKLSNGFIKLVYDGFQTKVSAVSYSFIVNQLILQNHELTHCIQHRIHTTGVDFDGTGFFFSRTSASTIS